MKLINQTLLFLILVFICGCSTIQNNQAPFSSFTGKEVIIKRPVYLYEYVFTSFLGSTSTLETLWENGQPTDLVQDSRMFSKPAREVSTPYGVSYSFYPLKDYSDTDRIYSLSSTKNFANGVIDENHFLGPLKRYDIPAGTPVFISKSYTTPIDSVCHESDGTLVIPGSNRKVKFTYILGCGAEISRAPWEDDSVPAIRVVGWNGKSYKP